MRLLVPISNKCIWYKYNYVMNTTSRDTCVPDTQNDKSWYAGARTGRSMFSGFNVYESQNYEGIRSPRRVCNYLHRYATLIV